jgi:hypothetical protein
LVFLKGKRKNQTQHPDEMRQKGPRELGWIEVEASASEASALSDL